MGMKSRNSLSMGMGWQHAADMAIELNMARQLRHAHQETHHFTAPSPIGHKLNVLRHELAVHANEIHRQSIHNKLLLNLNSLSDDVLDSLLGQLVVELAAVIGTSGTQD